MRTRRPSFLAVPVLLCAILWGCSQSSPHPPTLGDCEGPPGACVTGPTIQTSVPPSPDGSVLDAADASSGLSCGNLTRSDPVCEACLEQSCCTFALVCSNNVDCAGLTQCIGLCQPTDAPCIAGCQNSHPVGQPNYNDLAQCLRTNCSLACQLADAGAGCGTLVFSTPACDTCVARSCCGVAGVCAGDPDCILLAQCLQVCMPNDTNCIASCQAGSPNGVGVYSALGQCIQANCTPDCQ